MLTETAYAKINLALHVRARRADGYHEIESLFAFAEDGDALAAETRRDGRINLYIEGPFAAGLSAGPDNLVARSAEALQRAYAVQAGADIRLTKNLPVASGIGGGSADAAATLRLLARLWDIDPGFAQPSEAGDRFPSSGELFSLAAGLGSDVPACLVSRTLVGTGRGEALDLRDIAGLSGKPLLLVNPGKALSTAAVFAGWDGQDRGALRCVSLEKIAAEGRNDLQGPAMDIVPEIAQVLTALGAIEGIILARMSGSGATCFALMEDEAALARAAETLQRVHPDWWVMTSRVR